MKTYELYDDDVIWSLGRTLSDNWNMDNLLALRDCAVSHGYKVELATLCGAIKISEKNSGQYAEWFKSRMEEI